MMGLSEFNALEKSLERAGLPPYVDGGSFLDGSSFRYLRRVILKTTPSSKIFFPVSKQSLGMRGGKIEIPQAHRQDLHGTSRLVLHARFDKEKVRTIFSPDFRETTTCWFAMEYVNRERVDTSKARPLDTRRFDIISPPAEALSLYHAFCLFDVLPAIMPHTHRDVSAAFDHPSLKKQELARLSFCFAPPAFTQGDIRDYRLDPHHPPQEAVAAFNNLYAGINEREIPKRDASVLTFVFAAVRRFGF